MDVKSALLNLGDRCLRLAEQIDSSGSELNSDEKQLVRLAGLPMIQESQDMLLTAYLTGNYDFAKQNIERITNMVKDYI